MAKATHANEMQTEMAEEMSEESLYSEETLDESESELAVKGINLLVNNKWPEAEKLFQAYK